MYDSILKNLPQIIAVADSVKFLIGVKTYTKNQHVKNETTKITIKYRNLAG
jgi:hypothetical protein